MITHGVTFGGQWRQVRLRFVADINPLPPGRASLGDEEEVSFLPMEAIGEDGSIKLDLVRPVADLRAGYSFFTDGDVAFAKVTPCFENGKGALMRGLVGGLGFGTTELTVLRPKSVLDARFLHYFLTSPPFRGPGAGAMTGAGGLKRVPEEFTRNTLLPLPPLAVQQAIADYLDRETASIDALIEKKTRFIELLREKRQAVISQTVTSGIAPDVPRMNSGIEWLGNIPTHWQVQPMKYIGDTMIGLTYAPEEVVGEGEGVLVLRASNIQGGRLAFEDNVYVSTPIPDDLRTRPGDILICSRSGSRDLIGKCALIDAASSGHSFGAFTIVFRSRHSRFLYYVLSSSLFTFQAGRFLTTTINQLTTETLKSFEVALPPIDEQQRICDFLDRVLTRIDSVSAATIRSIGVLRERRAALITAAVTGQIDVRAEHHAEDLEPA